jgi:Sel1 repeat
VASIREPIANREFKLCVHPLQRRRFWLAIVFAIILFPAIALATIVGTLAFGLVPLIALLLWLSGRIFFAKFLGNSILVTPVNYPRIHDIAEEMKTVLNYQKPVYIFVYQEEFFNAFMRKFFFRRAIFLNSDVLNTGVSDDEVRWLIGRFFGYWYARRRFGFFGWLIRVAERFVIFNFFILPYERGTVYTGDRLALAAINGDISSAVAAMQKLLVGRQLGYSVNPEGMVEQHRLVKGSIFAFLARITSFFPHMTARYVDLIAFAKQTYPVQYAKFEGANPQLPADAARLAPPPSRHRGRTLAVAAAAVILFVALFLGGGVMLDRFSGHSLMTMLPQSGAGDEDDDAPPRTYSFNSDNNTSPDRPSPAAPAPAPSTEDLNDQGIDAYNDRDYQSAMRLWRQAAAQGNSDAAENIGLLYQDSSGVPEDYGQAMQWYQRAAAQGSATAQDAIGFLYKNGYGVTRNYALAMQWFQKAATQNDVQAQIQIGVLYQSGLGVKPDPVQALQWYRKAADQGNPVGQYLVGLMYEGGQGVAQNLNEAIAWYRKAAAQGNNDAQDRLDTLGVK